MADCGSSDYQAVEYAGLFDLKGAQILRAEINSIDPAAKTADITLLDQCDTYASKDLSAVGFYYHCEDSTGTTEELERGWMAFKPMDMVAVLAVPARGEVEERFFIVGHVDIRGTKTCMSRDILLIGMYVHLTGDPDPLGEFVEGTEKWVIMFDCNTGKMFDLASFENFDENSPPKPTEFPCEFNDQFTSWASYNFIGHPPAHSCPLSNPVDYTNFSGWTPGYSESATGCPWEGSWVENSGCTSLLYANATFKDLKPGYYYAEEFEEHISVTMPKGREGYEITDLVTMETGTITASFYMTMDIVAQGGVPPIYPAVMNWTGTQTIGYAVGTFCDINQDEFIQEEGESSCQPSMTGLPLLTKPYRRHDIGENYVSISGRTGFYTIFNGQDQCGVVPGWWPTPLREIPIIEACSDTPEYFYPWQSLTWVRDGSQLSPQEYPITLGLNYCTVTHFSDIDGDLEYQLSPFRCMRAFDRNASRGLSEAFAFFKTFIFHRSFTNNPTTIGYWAWEKPFLFEVFSKKEPEV